MADRLLRAQVTIPMVSNIPADAVVNTFYFDQDDNGILPDPSESYSSVMSKLTTFYQAIDGVVYPATVGSTATVRIYDMRDPEPRVVRHTATIALTPSAGGSYPGEVAICLSFAATPTSGTPAARLRGRVYLGPVTTTAGATEANHVMVASATRTAIANAASALATPTDPGGDPVSSLSWAIYSPTLDSVGSIDDAFNDVQSGWIDNAFDTQRRRGTKATARTTWT